MRSRISIRGCVRPSVRPSVGRSHTSWISEKWAEFEQNSIRTMKLSHLKDDSKTSTLAVRQNASVVRTLFDLFFLFQLPPLQNEEERRKLSKLEILRGAKEFVNRLRLQEVALADEKAQLKEKQKASEERLCTNENSKSKLVTNFFFLLYARNSSQKYISMQTYWWASQ